MESNNLLTKKNEITNLKEALTHETLISVDTEFIRETTFFPKIALIQIGTSDKTWLVDPSVLSKQDLEPLLTILLDPKVLKVMHAAYADQECFFYTYQMIAEPILDTAVAAALCGMGDNIGLAKLTRELMGVVLPKGRARAKWLQRPLSNDLLNYASLDVKYLVAIGEKLKETLQSKSRLEWAFEESFVDTSYFEESPESIASRIGKNHHMDSQGHPILVELVRWREQRAREANLPRNWVADNEVLLALCKVRPKTFEELKTFRGLNVKEVERSHLKILEAVQVGLKAEPVHRRPPERSYLIPSSEAGHIVDFIQTYISYLAHHLEIAPRFLMNVTQTEQLVNQWGKEITEWISSGILSRRAADLIGNELKGLLSGKKALAVKDSKLQVLELSLS